MKRFFLILLLYFNGFSQAGSFDTSFDDNGKNTTCFQAGTSSNTIDAGFQAGGKIVSLIFDFNNPINLVRWNSDGTLDTTFGNNGNKIYSNAFPFINGGYYTFGMVIQNDDKIIIMGLQQNNTYSNAYWIARLLPDGALDPSFSEDGYRDLSFGTPQDRGTCVNIQPDGKILIGGTSGSTAQFFTVARLLTNGDLDPSFGINGVVQTPFDGGESFAQSIAVQSDGKILLGGYTVTAFHAKDFALIRYNTDGSIDTGFGSNGKVKTTISNNSDLITSLVIEPDGKIVAGGFMSSENNPFMCLVRYLANGTVDTTFGVNGVVINTDDNSRNCSIARQVDGKIIMGGGFDGVFFLIIRYNANGTKDSSFGTNGVVNVFPVTYGYAAKVLIQPDHKIVAGGSTLSPDFTQVCSAVVRLDPGTLDVEEFATSSVQVYPNPTSGVVSFANSNGLIDTVRVYNVLGQAVLNPLNPSTSSGQATPSDTSVNLSGLPSGVYMLEFAGNGIKKVARVVKE